MSLNFLSNLGLSRPMSGEDTLGAGRRRGAPRIADERDHVGCSSHHPEYNKHKLHMNNHRRGGEGGGDGDGTEEEQCAYCLSGDTSSGDVLTWQRIMSVGSVGRSPTFTPAHAPARIVRTYDVNDCALYVEAFTDEVNVKTVFHFSFRMRQMR